MTLHSLRPLSRPDNLKNQARAAQSLARKIYLAALVGAGCWVLFLVFGPMIFMEANGMVLEDEEVVSPSFSAQLLTISVRPGDKVAAGDQIGKVLSTQMIDLISDLTSRKGQFDVRKAQIDARLSAIDAMLPVAQQRIKHSGAAYAVVDQAMARGYSTTTRLLEATRDRFEAEREVASLRAEQAGLTSERASVLSNLVRLQEAVDAAQRSYRDGAIISPVAGTLGAHVATPGTVLSPGAAGKIAEIYHGKQFILAYLPTNRIYAADPGQTVVITDGFKRQVGRIEAVGNITDQLPAEFQSAFRTIERQQLARISIEDGGAFPLLAKIRVTTPLAPSNVITSAPEAIVSAVVSSSKWLIAAFARDRNPAPEYGMLGIRLAARETPLEPREKAQRK
ncbi:MULTISPECIES: HlyD family secretion protein [Methylocystis]|uniref:HlyD family efflux transporter periplasmic adaptor subunit n=1 Tax=Methylocystis iwaonis TaxID=2885079 RepID=A0ABM8EE56_9HYPH|nr:MULTISPECIES: hypothetical protein [Methylocystis]MBL1257756.1 hypothetical protein [Methylocystis sp. Sn-Cys]BDV36261.1 hypothetical protein SS37A_37910 [Methylocystis iwaonis]